jgi:hypothetical protein
MNIADCLTLHLNPEQRATCGIQDKEKQNKNTAQNVLDTTIQRFDFFSHKIRFRLYSKI